MDEKFEVKQKTKIAKIKIWFLKTTLVAFVYELLGRTLIIPMFFWIIKYFDPKFIAPELPSLQPILQKAIAQILGVI